MRNITFVFIFFGPLFGYGQELSMLRGKIVADSLQVDAIHILNQTQNAGVINDQSGLFEIRANPGDTIIFSSIQYAIKQYVVTRQDIDSENLTIELEHSVNELDEVFLSQHTLTGKIEEDLSKIPTYTKNLPFWSAAELKQMGVSGFNDAQSPVKNLVLDDEMDATPINLMDLVGVVAKAFKGKRKYIETNYEMTDFYEEKFVVNALEIPETEYYNFIDFVNEQPGTAVVINSNDKLKILEFLIDQSMVFKEKYNIKQ